MQPISIESKKTIDRMMLWICPAIILMDVVVGLIAGYDDLVRLFAWNALLVELVIFYWPARSFIERRGGKKAFGLIRVSAGEWVWAVLFGIGAFFISTALNGMMQLLWQGLGANEPLISTPLPMDGGWRLFASLFLIAVIPALAEETLFRSALLHAWLPQGKTRAVWHSALLFALIHLQPGALPSLLLLGLLMGAITLLTGSVYPAMVVHGVNNAIAVLLSAAAGKEALAAASQPLVAAELLPGLLIYTVIGAVGVFVSYQGLKRAASKRRAVPAEELLTMRELRPFGGAHAAEKADTAAAQESPAPPQYRPGEKRHGTGKLAVTLTYALMIFLNVLLFVLMFIDLPMPVGL